MSRYELAQGRRADNRQPASPEPAPERGGFASHAIGSPLRVQSAPAAISLPHYPFQPLPTPRGQPPYRFDLSQLLSAGAIKTITDAGKLVIHTVGDTGDARGKEMDFVAAMLTADYDASPDNAIPAAFYHLGDVVYFAGDIDKYGDVFYETYAEYPALIVSIPGNHDCQPDDPQDGPVDPNKVPLDGWVQNFMSDDPTRLGSLKTTSSRTQMDLPNVYWTFTTPLATFIGLFSNVGETEAEIHQDQIDWFRGELQAAAAADPEKALIVTIHHPPYSGDAEHSGSSVSEKVLFESFAATGVWPHLVLSGHVHNYQRFTTRNAVSSSELDVTCVVAGNGGYSKLGKLQKIKGAYPQAPLTLSPTLSLESYDQTNFGFVRLEITAREITGLYTSAPYAEERTPEAKVMDQWTLPLRAVTVAA
jgi:acid phosphatase type 7